MPMFIKRNAAQCPKCLDIIESKSKHNLVACKCYKSSGGKTGIYVEGGTDKIQRGGPDKWTCIELSEFYNEDEE